MGTALTAEQVGELARMATTVLLALDADTAGQDAMLRASALAARRKLELRVVELPAGSDPAELVQREGAAAVRELIERSVPFVRFRVERVLAQGDRSSPEGRDRMLEQLRPVIATLPASAMRMELTRLVAERLQLPQSLAERALAQVERGGAGGTGTRSMADAVAVGGARGAGSAAAMGSVRPADAAEPRAQSARGSSTERAFLALCIANPGAGAQALAELDLADSFTSDLVRRAAEHLREHPSDPVARLPQDDDELSALVAQLVVEAGEESARSDMLEVQRLQLELARMDRHIHGIRASDVGEVSELAQRRTEVRLEFERAYARVLEGKEEGG
jgi:DNA primase